MEITTKSSIKVKANGPLSAVFVFSGWKVEAMRGPIKAVFEGAAFVLIPSIAVSLQAPVEAQPWSPMSLDP